jgi:xanthine dehydrogenase molybdopterin-binding subunit B
LFPYLDPICNKKFTTGEIQYVDDIPNYPGELQAAYVLTKQAPGEITGYDTENAAVKIW